MDDYTRTSEEAQIFDLFYELTTEQKQHCLRSLRQMLNSDLGDCPEEDYKQRIEQISLLDLEPDDT